MQKRAPERAPASLRPRGPRHSGGTPNAALLSALDADGVPAAGPDLKGAILSRFSFSSGAALSEARPIQLSSVIQQKAEQRYQVPLEGMRAFEDEGLRDAGLNGYAHGAEIHIDGGLPPQERERVILHEVGHVVQRGSGMANGGAFLDSPMLEGLADSGFSAPQSFVMPAAAAGPVMGDYEADLAKYRTWKNERLTPQNLALATAQRNEAFFTQQQHVYESVAGNGTIGSIYYGSGDGTAEGGRLRLLHSHGPEVAHHDHVLRFTNGNRGEGPFPPTLPITPDDGGVPINAAALAAFNPLDIHAVQEKMVTGANQHLSRHPSRGQAVKSNEVAALAAKDHAKLLHAVEFAQQTWGKDNPQDGNNFLYAYMKSHPRLADIPLNERGFRKKFWYRFALSSWRARRDKARRRK